MVGLGLRLMFRIGCKLLEAFLYGTQSSRKVYLCFDEGGTV